MNSILHLIGIAKKAGRLEIGEEPVGGACRARQAKLILLAADAAENSARRAKHFAEGGDAHAVVTPFTKEELGGCVGRSSCAMMAVTDAGLAAALVKKLAESDPERYAEAAGRLTVRADKAIQRQKEQRAHEKNLREGKKKPWSPPAKASPLGTHPIEKPKSEAEANALAAEARLDRKKPPVPKGRITVKGKIPAGLKKTP